MNGYQCYLKRIPQVIWDEVACSKALGYNLSIKLIRGAYLNEERYIARRDGVEVPIWDTIEETHAAYNKCVNHILDNLDDKSFLFVASHNQNTVNMVLKRLKELNITDSRVRFG